MYLTLDEVAYVKPDATTAWTIYSDRPHNGFVYAISCTTGTVPSTGKVYVCEEGSTENLMLNGVSISAGGWYLLPRVATHDTTGVQLANGTTGAGIYPEMKGIVDKRFAIAVSGATCSGETMGLKFYVEGN